jgi:hypothetical protein
MNQWKRRMLRLEAKRARRKARRAGGQRRRQSNRVVLPGAGPACPRCGRPMQIREHRDITAELLRKPYYFSRWYRCMHRDCKTTLVTPDEFKVYNQPENRNTAERG